MCALFRNKYHIGSKRYPGYDYSKPGKYFITICTKDRLHYFGEIENGKMILSEIGICLRDEWLKIPEIRPDMNIIIDEYVIMPDHFHAIIIIGENQYNNKYIRNLHRRNAMHGVSTITFVWQPRFYDRIIRSGSELSRIRRYIIDNPGKYQNKSKSIVI
ncbi:MAG TPA: hypothetical protein DDW27_07165 [Bacteroidales bacterium]|nr:hypothetical protein [Bacteroidales bacterium]